MKRILYGCLLLSSLALVGVSVSKQRLCDGIVPPNSLNIPVTKIQSGGISQQQFNGVLDKLQAYYEPVIQAKGAVYQINRLWNDGTVNAYAERDGNTWIINMFGGLARYDIMTEDGFTLVACHETGHQLGGAPKFSMNTDWAAVEGQADYYGALDCLRYIWGKDDNAQWATAHSVDPVAQKTCAQQYSNAQEAGLCMRSAMAGEVLSILFQQLKQESTIPRFDTPNPTQVSQMFEDHPETQCRMDTYFQASLCVHDLSVEPGATDPHVGACTDYAKPGARPRCWYFPGGSSPELAPVASN